MAPTAISNNYKSSIQVFMENSASNRKISKSIFYTFLVIFLAVMGILIHKVYLNYQQRGVSDTGELQDYPYSHYSTGSGKVYYLKVGSGYFLVNGADPRTFMTFNTVNDRGTMGKDARQVYFKTAPVPGLKPADLIEYLGYNFAKRNLASFMETIF